MMGPWHAARYRDGVARLTDYLTAAGVVDPGDPGQRIWLTGLHEVPRHKFVPTRAWASPFVDGATAREIDAGRDATDWMSAIYTNTSIITQRDDGQADIADTTAPPTCSLSCPHISMRYLTLLQLKDHHRVLEIGAGTGWTAAMLAWRLGGDQVVTVEVDELLAKTAAANLAEAAQQPRLFCRDGAGGHVEHAPFDRVHVTCGVRKIPYVWVSQTRPSGLIVVPFGDGGQFQLVLRVTRSGDAIGRVRGTGGFMMLRSQRGTAGRRVDWDGEDVATTATNVDPRLLLEGGAAAALHAHIADVHTDSRWEQDEDVWRRVITLTDQGGTSAATVTCTPGDGAYVVRQDGARPLWDEAERALVWWWRHDSPRAERFGVTVRADRTWWWLDTPQHLITR
jgi:protein-L-isoaspartate(D-aspartate) O-methyltransferase